MGRRQSSHKSTAGKPIQVSPAVSLSLASRRGDPFCFHPFGLYSSFVGSSRRSNQSCLSLLNRGSKSVMTGTISNRIAFRSCSRSCLPKRTNLSRILDE